MSLLITTSKGLRAITVMVVAIVLGVTLFSRINFEPSIYMVLLVSSAFAIAFIYWVYLAIFKYELVRETKSTIYESFFKKWNAKKAFFSLFSTVVIGSLFLVMLIKSFLFAIGGVATFTTGESLSLEVTCDYSVYNRFYGVSNYFVDELGSRYMVKSDSFFCDRFGESGKQCQIKLTRNLLGDRYQNVLCRD